MLLPTQPAGKTGKPLIRLSPVPAPSSQACPFSAADNQSPSAVVLRRPQAHLSAHSQSACQLPRCGPLGFPPCFQVFCLKLHTAVTIKYFSGGKPPKSGFDMETIKGHENRSDEEPSRWEGRESQVGPPRAVCLSMRFQTCINSAIPFTKA